MQTDQESAFIDLYRRRYRAVYAYAYSRVGADRAADVTADAFLVMWRRLPELLPEQELPWLYSTARQVIANALRGDSRREALVDALSAKWSVDQAGRGGDTELGYERSAAVREALLALSTADRELLLLVAWEGLDPAGCAEALGYSVAAVKVRTHRARRRFEKHWTAFHNNVIDLGNSSNKLQSIKETTR